MLAVVFALPFVFGPLMRADREHATLAGVEGPHCPVSQIFGFKVCPGCGLTRGFVLTLHGAFGTAVEVHPLAPVFVALCFAAAILHGATAWRGGDDERTRRWFKAGRALFLAATAATVAMRLAEV